MGYIILAKLSLMNIRASKNSNVNLQFIVRKITIITTITMVQSSCFQISLPNRNPACEATVNCCPKVCGLL